MWVIAHVGHCQLEPDCYPTALVFFSICCHCLGYPQLQSYEVISHGYLWSSVMKRPRSLRDYQSWFWSPIFSFLCHGRFRSSYLYEGECKTPRPAKLEDWSSLCFFSTPMATVETFHVVVSKCSSIDHLLRRLNVLCLMILHALFHSSVVFTLTWRNIIELTAKNQLSCFSWVKGWPWYCWDLNLYI